jgi:WD40 repeat protein
MLQICGSNFWTKVHLWILETIVHRFITPPALVPIGENPSSLTAFTASLDESIKVWDLETGDCRGTWRSPRPYEGMKIRNIHGLTEAQTATLTALGAVAENQ